MSTPAQRDNLARIRDNQRRSRARRREYLQELEHRLRVCELQGVEASAEVQMAARRVAEENKQLRGLLNKHGISDEYIAHYLHTGSAMSAEQAASHPFSTGYPGMAVQTMHQVMAPRRPVGLDPNVVFPLPSQSSRETSAASVSTTNSSAWESVQPPMGSYGHHRPSMDATPHVSNSPAQQPYHYQVFDGSSTSESTFSGPSSASLLDVSHQQANTSQSLPLENRSIPQENVPMGQYQHPGPRDYNNHGGY